MSNSMKKAWHRSKVRRTAAELYNSSANDRVARAKAELLLGPRPQPTGDMAETMRSSKSHKYYDNTEMTAEERERDASQRKLVRLQARQIADLEARQEAEQLELQERRKLRIRERIIERSKSKSKERSSSKAAEAEGWDDIQARLKASEQKVLQNRREYQH